MSTVPTPALSLDGAQSTLNAAEDALRGWHAKHTDVSTGANYVRDGHDTIRFIDELTRELHKVREALCVEIYTDDIDRAARVDELLATIRAERAERERDEDREHYDREEPTGQPVPDGVEGHQVGRNWFRPATQGQVWSRR